MSGRSARAARTAGVLLSVILVACSDPVAPVATPGPSPTTAPSQVASPGIAPGGSTWYDTATTFDDELGARFLFTCPSGGFTGFVWGTDTYTTSSWVCTAAVHAGLITYAAGGPAVIEITPGLDSYTGSIRNGVTSSSYDSWDHSFVFVAASASPVPSALPTGPQASPTSAASVVPSPTAAPSSSVELVKAGSLIVCTPFGRTNFAELDENGQPFGVDVEIGLAIAAQMQLLPEIVDTPFEELIDAVTNSECDVSIGGQFITQARLELIGMIPYREGTPHVLVPFGNPLGISQLTDLCGRRFGVVSGTVYVDMVVGTGDYVGRGLDEQCATAGSPAVDLRQFTTQDDAETAFANGEVDAYAGNDFLARERPGEFEWAMELPLVRNGIGHRLDALVLDGTVRAALRSMIADGSYLEILAAYGAEEIALTISP